CRSYPQFRSQSGSLQPSPTASLLPRSTEALIAFVDVKSSVCGTSRILTAPPPGSFAMAGWIFGYPEIGPRLVPLRLRRRRRADEVRLRLHDVRSEFKRSRTGEVAPMFVVNIANDSAGQWLANSIQFSVPEAGAPGTGSDVIFAKLSEVLFIETLRRFIQNLP